MSRSAWSGHKTANSVTPREQRVRPADAGREPVTDGLLAQMVHEPRPEGDERDRAYLVEIRYCWLVLQPAADEPKACAVYARPDGQIVYRLYDADAGDVWEFDPTEVYASVLVDTRVRDPEPLDDETSVGDLCDAYRLLIAERHLGGEGA